MECSRTAAGTNGHFPERNGVRLARITGQALSHVKFDLIITSPLKRARQTAELVTEGKSIPIFEMPS